MYDKEKIIIMAKLAVYDEKYGDEDRRKNQYFRHDYIYRQNMWVRFFVLLGSLILVLFYMMHRIAIDGEDLVDILASGAYMPELIRIILFILVLQVAYTIIGTIIYTASYEKSKKRLENYNRLLNQLEKRNRAMDGKFATNPVSSGKSNTAAARDGIFDEDLDEIPEPVDPVLLASTKFRTQEAFKRTASAKPSRPVLQNRQNALVYRSTLKTPVDEPKDE